MMARVPLSILCAVLLAALPGSSVARGAGDAQSLLDEVHGGIVHSRGKRAVDLWFDQAAGQGSYDYSVWCEQNGLPDGWPVSDPDVRTHRTPSMTAPKMILASG